MEVELAWSRSLADHFRHGSFEDPRAWSEACRGHQSGPLRAVGADVRAVDPESGDVCDLVAQRFEKQRLRGFEQGRIEAYDATAGVAPAEGAAEA
jgi:hypothetical protein